VVVGVVASFSAVEVSFPAVDASLSAAEASLPAFEADVSSVVDSFSAVELSFSTEVCVRVDRVAGEVVATADVAIDESTAVVVEGLDSLDSVSTG
jgi:hypothetical protein